MEMVLLLMVTIREGKTIQVEGIGDSFLIRPAYSVNKLYMTVIR